MYFFVKIIYVSPELHTNSVNFLLMNQTELSQNMYQYSI